MMKTLRRKFVVITMCSVCMVLFLMMGIINLVSFREINKEADEVLKILTDNEGMFPKMDKPFHESKKLPRKISPEMPYETRFFSVALNKQGEVLRSNTGSIAALEREEAVGYAKAVFKAGKVSGFQGSYKYSMVRKGDETVVVFLDCTRSLSNFRSFLFISIIVSLSGLLLIFVLVMILSGRAVKPVAESYTKQKRFLTDAGHEIKTPLAIIKADTEVLELESGENKWTASIRNQIARLSELTEGLVSLAKLDETKSILSMEMFNLSEAVCETADTFLPAAEKKGIKMERQLEEGVTMRGDEKALRHMVFILLDNAVKYTEEGGRVCLSLKKQAGRVRFRVCNTAEEMEKGSQDILFERFYRREASRNSETGGHGIGLSIAKSIVEAHKGNITARSTDGKSLEIFVQF